MRTDFLFLHRPTEMTTVSAANIHVLDQVLWPAAQCDIGVHSEEVRRIIAILQRDQMLQLPAIGRLETGRTLVREEVRVYPTAVRAMREGWV